MPELAVGETLQRALRTTWRHAPTLMLTQGVVVIAVALAALYVDLHFGSDLALSAFQLRGAILPLAGLALVSLVIGSLGSVLGLLVADKVERGELLEVRALWSSALKSYARALMTNAAAGFALAGFGLATVAIYGERERVSWWLAALGIGICLSAAAYAQTRWSLALAVSVFETRAAPFVNMARSGHLTQGAKFAFFILFLNIALLVGIPLYILRLPLTVALHDSEALVYVIWAFSTVASLASGFITSTATLIAYRRLATEPRPPADRQALALP